MPWKKELYPVNWREIVAAVRDRSGGRCEQCGAYNKEPHPETGSKVVLTCAHLNHDTADNRMSNLRHLCQRDHLRHDAAHHAETARRTRDARRGQTRLEML
jgi:hypothetical protein